MKKIHSPMNNTSGNHINIICRQKLLSLFGSKSNAIPFSLS